MVSKVIHASGKRKSAVARATLKRGTGIVHFNNARLEAVNLAREAIEVVVAKRDGNWLSGLVWDAGLSSGADYTAAPFYDPVSNVWTLNFTPNNLGHNFAVVWLEKSLADPKSAVFRQANFVSVPDNVEQTPYSRLLTLDQICQNKTIVSSGSSCAGEVIGRRVQAQVGWIFKGRQRNVVLEERIFNWR